MPAKKTATSKRTTKAKAATTTYGPERFELEIETGALFGLDPDGIQRAPVACGVHHSAAVHESATDDLDELAEGFDPSCEDCVAQADSTAAYADQHHTV